MTEWTPQAGDLVENPHGEWGVLHGRELTGWLCAGWHIAGPDGHGGDKDKCKLLCRAGDMATCWAELAKLPGARANGAAVVEVRLETGWLECEYQDSEYWLCWLPDSPNDPDDTHDDDHWTDPANYEARTRDLQKEGALRAYIAACKEQS